MSKGSLRPMYIIYDSKKVVPNLQDVWPNPDSTQRLELHISLSRPIFLRAHQREDLKRAVKRISQANKAFTLSFAVLSELVNDEKTRTFLTMEVGAGHHELRSLADSLTPALRAIRQQEYYVNPRFHASIAWALLHRSQGTPFPPSGSSDSICTRAILEDPPAPSIAPGSGATTPEGFPAIECLPADMIKMLNERYGAQIASPKVGSFEVHAITVKIGKEVTSWQLN
ncbi:unnamed protein product [Cyclocybe aegerita]|uniref:U6 snRNA phosphodiesterase 1 n=1 Tax=Cyclocybe aegerita TaxID=1973307 RepID=A0A8S0VU27_CYCAE|nr:unnamed protein product [Cyclocybe aegerita]